MLLQSRVAGRWTTPDDEGAPLLDALTGREVARVSTRAVPAAEALEHARSVGSPALQAMSYPQRAALLKALALHLQEHQDELVELAFTTGATRADSAVDVGGGIGTLLAYASRGRRELPDGPLLDGPVEQLGRRGDFVGRHLLTPLAGAVLQVNAYNFPVWGPLEKLAPAFLSGVPSVVKPAPQTAHVTAALVRLVVESELLPEGSVQLLVGGTDGLLDGLTGQDLLSVTGSAATVAALRGHPAVVRAGTRFTAEADSLNACVLGPDTAAGLDLLVREVARETTAKAGQKCTAVRRVLVPRSALDDVQEALVARLSAAVVGDPREEATEVGPLVSAAQRDRVLEGVSRLAAAGRTVLEGRAGGGALLSPVVVRVDDPRTPAPHEVEAFGPVTTLLPYDDPADVVGLLALGRGSLVATVVSGDAGFVRDVVRGTASAHGRLHVLDATSARESTGHGSPLPALVHGGPGRAGGGEELGGMRAVHHHHQRTAVQGSPDALTAVTGTWTRGAARRVTDVHPFRKTLSELQVGDTAETASRTITAEDVAHFAEFTGDTFYAHTDEAAAAANPLFGGIVAHGYLVLSLAAGLFVDPAPGPVLANTGLDRLRFTKPVKPGDSIRVLLTCASTVRRSASQGEVRWDVTVLDQTDAVVASYELLTMVSD